MKKRDRIIAAVNTHVRHNTHKYGLKVPTSVAHALEIDKKNGNTYWADAIAKEMYITMYQLLSRFWSMARTCQLVTLSLVVT